jgi:putative membrane protein
MFPSFFLILTTLFGNPAPRGQAAAPPPLDDATIVAIFDAANGFDIETGTLGSTKGSNATVRSVGAALVRDHMAVRQQGRDLAKKLGVTPTPPAENPFGAQHTAAMALLRSKKGTQFDLAFLDHEIAYHQAVIDAVGKTLLPAIQNAELKAFVEKIAPAFQAHLDMCKAARTQISARRP